MGKKLAERSRNSDLTFLQTEQTTGANPPSVVERSACTNQDQCQCNQKSRDGAVQPPQQDEIETSQTPSIQNNANHFSRLPSPLEAQHRYVGNQVDTQPVVVGKKKQQPTVPEQLQVVDTRLAIKNVEDKDITIGAVA